jgi:hypothetical protein
MHFAFIVQKNLSSISCAISSTWIKLDELNFLISSIYNIGVTLYNIGHLEEVPFRGPGLLLKFAFPYGLLYG